MLLTVEEAQRKECVAPRPGRLHCSADECMGWRPVDPSIRLLNPKDAAEAKLRWDPKLLTFESTDKSLYVVDEPRGFCGLAGKPE